MTPEFVSKFTNTFIIRDPKYVVSSLYKMWPDFTLQEVGYEELHRLFEYAMETGQEAVIVDASDLMKNPEGTVAAYCERLGMPFKSEALSWKPRKVPEWEIWDEWHTEAQQSTGISEELPKEDAPLSEELQEVYNHCWPYYEALHERRLRPIELGTG